MANFAQERAWAERLTQRLGLAVAQFSNPGTNPETGSDVIALLSDGRKVGIQVTVLDPHAEPGRARAAEKKLMGKDYPKNQRVYGDWAENRPEVVLLALRQTITCKVKKASPHNFDGVQEVWLLIGAGEPGAAVSTFLVTSPLGVVELDTTTGPTLQGSKYDRCFILLTLGLEEVLYTWEKGAGWEKSVRAEEILALSRPTYVNSLMKAAEVGNWEEVDRLADEECRNVLTDTRLT